MEFLYTDFLTPVDFMNCYSIMEEIKQRNQEEADNIKREQYK